MTNTPETLAAAREIAGESVPALAFHSVGASYRHALFAPLLEGGIRDYQEVVDAYMMDPEVPRAEEERRFIMDAVSLNQVNCSELMHLRCYLPRMES